MVHTVLAPRQQQFHVVPAIQQPKTDVSTPLRWILKRRAIKEYSHSSRITCDMCAMSLLESREQLYIKAMNNNKKKTVAILPLCPVPCCCTTWYPVPCCCTTFVSCPMLLYYPGVATCCCVLSHVAVLDINNNSKKKKKNVAILPLCPVPCCCTTLVS